MAIEDRVEALDARVDKLRLNVSALSLQMQDLAYRLTALESEQLSNDMRLSRLEREVEQRVKALDAI